MSYCNSLSHLSGSPGKATQFFAPFLYLERNDTFRSDRPDGSQVVGHVDVTKVRSILPGLDPGVHQCGRTVAFRNPVPTQPNQGVVQTTWPLSTSWTTHALIPSHHLYSLSPLVPQGLLLTWSAQMVPNQVFFQGIALLCEDTKFERNFILWRIRN